MSGGGPMAVYLYLLGRHADALRVATGGGELVLLRAHRLPLRALREAARAGGYLAVCPWVEGADGRALVALWTYAQDHERAVSTLPAGLAPQVIVHAPVGATLVWILSAPYPEGPADGRPDAAALLAELAEVLGTIPASPADMLPMPSVEADLVILDRDGTTDSEALWTWAHGTADTARKRARRTATEMAATAVRAGEGDVANTAGESEAPSAKKVTDSTALTLLDVLQAGPEAETEVCARAGTYAGPAPAGGSVLRSYVSDQKSETPVHETSPVADAQPDMLIQVGNGTRDGEMAVHPAEHAEMNEAANDIAAGKGIGEITSDATSALHRELVGGPVDTSSATDRDPQPGIDPTIEEGFPTRVVPEPGRVVISASIADGFDDFPAPLRSLLVATAQAQRLSTREAVADAVLSYAFTILGTREVHALMGVSLTWKRADGLHVLTRDGWWRKLTDLS